MNIARKPEDKLIKLLRDLSLGYQNFILKKTGNKVSPASLVLIWAISTSMLSKISFASGKIGEAKYERFRFMAAEECVLHAISGFFGSMNEQGIEEGENIFIKYVNETDEFVDKMFNREYDSFRSMIMTQLREGMMSREAISDSDSSDVITLAAVGIALDSFEKARSL